MTEARPILARLQDLPDHGLKEVTAAGRKILLVREGSHITAMDATCPHAGGPLAEGVLADGKITCPWHKAAFCARTGKRADPPAVDDLETFPLEIHDGAIMLAPPAGAPDPRRFVIIGAGAAGFSAAQSLRKAGFGGTVTMLSGEPDLPYDRTILSKYVLAGQDADEKSPLQDADFYATQNIERRLARVTGLNAETKHIELADGQSLAYDAALIATGGSVKPPPFPGSDLANVFTLRSQADAHAILAAASQSRRAVVIGASFIGMETAAALREHGLEVTVVAMESAPFEHQLGATVGNVYRSLHEEKGVAFRFNAQIERLCGENSVEAVQLQNGEMLPADIVIAGLGVKPATGFAKALIRKDDGALVVDDHLRLTHDLYAAGDIAAFPAYGHGPLIRVEHWRVAEQHGEIAARNMLGLNARYTAVPYFWTIQYMTRLDYVGHAAGSAPQVVRGDPGERSFIAYYVENGVVAAAAGMNKDRDMAAIIALMNQRQDWTVDELHPPSSSPYVTLTIQQAAAAIQIAD